MSGGAIRGLGLRLRHKLAVSLVIAALLPVLVAYWVGSSVVLRGLERGLRAETDKQLSVGLNLLIRDIEELGLEATRLASQQPLVDVVQENSEESHAVSTLLREGSLYLPASLVQVANIEGELIGRRDVGGGRARFAGIGVTSASPAILAGLAYERRVTVVRLGEQLVVRATAPVVDSNFDLVGVVVLSVPLDGVFADRLKASLGADVLLVAGADASGDPMVSFLDSEGARIADWGAAPSMLEVIASGNTAFLDQEILGQEYALGYAPIFDIEGHIVGIFGIAVDRGPVLEGRSAATRSLGLGAAGAFVFALGLAGLLSRRISRPLQNLHHGAIAIARGDLDHQIEIPEGDEIGDLAQAFSYMTTALKENQRRLAARMREIVALHDAGRAVSSVIEVDQVLGKVVDSVARVLHLRVCALWLVDTEAAGQGHPELVLGAVRAKRGNMRVIKSIEEASSLVRPLQMLAQDVAESRGTLRIEDMAVHPKYSKEAAEASIDGSLIASILERKGSVVGVIVVGRGSGTRVFSDEDANLLSAFADQAATAIENANLYAKVRKFNEELEAKVALRTSELQSMNNELGKAIYELKETQAQLTLSERLAGLGQLVAGVAHEINSPSAAIRGTADTLAGTIERLTRRQTRLQGIVGDSQRASELVALFEEVAPELAEQGRVPPAKIRRQARVLVEELTDAGLASESANAIAKRLAELAVNSQLLSDLLPHLRGDEEQARFVVDYLSDYVHVHRSTRTIQDAIRRIQRIVGSLKSYSHLDQNASRAYTDVHEGIENTLVIMEYQFSRGINVVRNYAALPAVPIFVDELNQVWTNLIHNAAQAVGEAGEIEIETVVINDGIAVRIIDNGSGISDEVMKRIFDPFFTTKAKGEGTGLGLGIVQQIIEKHQGKVTCDSRPGRTCFEVWLPVAAVAKKVGALSS